MTGTKDGAALRLKNQRDALGDEAPRFHMMRNIRGGKRCVRCNVQKIKGGWYFNGERLERRPQCRGERV